MANREIKDLFLKADEQIPVSKIRKQQAYDVLADEMDKQKISVMSIKDILFSLFWYMDKLFFYVYGVLICLGLVFISALRHMGAEQNGMIITCMIGAGALSIISISLINRLLFGGMAELGASCYFSTKQCVAACLVLAGAINLVILIFLSLYLGHYWKVSLLQVVLYVLTPYFTSSIAALWILGTKTGGRISYSLSICTFFLSIGYIVICSIPGVFLAAALWMWGIAFVVAGSLFIMQLRKLFKQIEKGEMLCMN